MSHSNSAAAAMQAAPPSEHEKSLPASLELAKAFRQYRIHLAKATTARNGIEINSKPTLVLYGKNSLEIDRY